jgi:hypothetical protein
LEGDGFEDAQDFFPKTGDTARRSGNSSRLFTVRPERGGLCLYGPHNPGSRICGGVIARGAQGQFPDRFCLKTDCRFTTHTTKSYLPKMISGGYYVKQNDTHGFAELCLTPEAAALAPEGLLQDPNTVAGWKAIIRQIEDQLSEGVSAPDAAAEQAAGLAEFALRVLKTPYATTPMRSRRRSLSGEDDGAAATGGPGTLEILQRLEDGLANLRGKLGFGPLQRGTSHSTVGWANWGPP